MMDENGLMYVQLRGYFATAPQYRNQCTKQTHKNLRTLWLLVCLCVCLCHWIKRSKRTGEQASDSAEPTNKWANERMSRRKKTYIILLHVSGALYILCVRFVFFSSSLYFFGITSTPSIDSSYILLLYYICLEQGVCYAIYLICPFIFLHRTHIFEPFFPNNNPKL